MLILNDIHIGFRRTGGTTPESQEALRQYLIGSLQALLAKHPNEPLAVVGDLFDDFEVSPRDWLAAYNIFNRHLQTCPQLILVAGNHDWTPRATRVSSFEVLSEVLHKQYPKKVSVAGIDHVTASDRAVFLAHCSSQENFERKLKAIWEEAEEGDTVFVHANFDNNFVTQSDHSLNVSREVCKSFVAHGINLVFAHEHQSKSAFEGKVYCLGNQWPTSISDCLGNSRKWVHLLTDGKLERVTSPTWDDGADGGYIELDWREIPKDGRFGTVRGGELCIDEPGFVRITGKASANEASEVINAISELRKKASPTVYVIGNSVKIDGLIEAEQLPESFEAAKRFDVMDFLSQHLNGEEMKVVEELLEKSE